MSKILFVPRFSNKGEFSPVFPTGDREIGYEVFIVCSDGVVRGSVLHTGVDHAGSVERIVGEKLTVTREIKVPLQPFSFIHQTLHLSMKYICSLNIELYKTIPDSPVKNTLQPS